MCRPLRDVCTLLTLVPSRLFMAGEAPTDTVWFERRLSRSPSETVSVKIRLDLCESVRQMYFVLDVCAHNCLPRTYTVSVTASCYTNTHIDTPIHDIRSWLLRQSPYKQTRTESGQIHLLCSTRWSTGSRLVSLGFFACGDLPRDFFWLGFDEEVLPHRHTHYLSFFNSCGSDTPRTPLGHTIRLVNLCFVQFLL